MDRKGMTLAEIIMSMLVLAATALAVTSVIVVTNSNKMRNASSGTGGGSLDLQALSHARATLELLKDAVSTNSAFSSALLVSATSYNTTSTLPAAFQSSPVSGTRTYLVSSVAGTDLKKVKVTVAWTDT
jgi:hypothetical protein